MLSVSLIHDIINVRFAWVGTGYRRPQARVGHYFKSVGQSPEWVGHGLPGLGLEPPLVMARKTKAQSERHTKSNTSVVLQVDFSRL